MKIIFHIGMGKTGTSSIQKILQNNADALNTQNVEYLGMWFDFLDPAYQGYNGQRLFFEQGQEDMDLRAKDFVAYISQQSAANGTELFIFSNESLFGHVESFSPFLTSLMSQGLEVEVIAYMRDPHSWLSSAFTQWGIRHKHAPGPIQPFDERGRTLIHQYDAIRIWHERFADIMTLRRHEKGVDVVQDFAQTAGVSITAGKKRYLERAEDTEVLMRALFNDRQPAAVLPERFNRLVLNTNKAPVRSIEEMAEICFKMEGVEEIVEEQRDLFEFIREAYGFDYLDGQAKERPPIDIEALRARLLDYLVESLFVQSERITRLERQLRDMNADK